MNIKTALGFILIFVGLVIAIAGFAERSSETISKKIEGQKIVLDNSAQNHANWQGYLGFVVASMGIATLAFPTQERIRQTQNS